MQLERNFTKGFVAGFAVAVLAVAAAKFAGIDFFSSKAAPPPQQAEPVAEKDLPFLGPLDAPLVLEEFADFYCGFCRESFPVLSKLMELYPGKIRWVFRHFPLSPKGKDSYLVHEAAVCAGRQGKFWPFHDLIFRSEVPLSQGDLQLMAEDLKLDKAAFTQCLENGEAHPVIEKDIEEVQKRGVGGTPTFFFSGEMIRGSLPLDQWKSKVELALGIESDEIPEAGEKGKLPEIVERSPSLGPKDAPVTVVEFSDFHCPFCGKLAPTLEKLMEVYPGKIRRVWRHFPLGMHAGAKHTHEASECAAEQGKFWEYHQKLFENPGGFQTDEDLIRAGKETGLKEDSFKSCLQSRKYASRIEEDIAEGVRVDVRGTPSVFVNSRLVRGAYPYETFVQLVEAELNPGKVVPAEPSVAQQVRFEDLEGRPAHGPEKAPVTVVEFSDFHCPFCKNSQSTLERLMTEFPGKVRRVWRHFPLDMHAGAKRTHEASECAAEQGKFWEYHQKLFEAQGQTLDDKTLLRLAEETGLKKGKFEKCLEGGKARETVERDIAKGNAIGVDGTPSFYINGKPLVGAQPYERFKELVEAELQSKS